MFYTYRQNNSGGVFSGYKYVIVEAENAERADEIAQDHGVYFNGCATGRDCSCCGDRWYPAWKDDGTTEPMIYGEPAKEFRDTFHKPGELLKIVYLSREVFASPDEIPQAFRDFIEQKITEVDEMKGTPAGYWMGGYGDAWRAANAEGGGDDE